MSREEAEGRVVTFADINNIENVSMFDVARLCDLLAEAVRNKGAQQISSGGRERALVITKLQEARMWAEEAMK